MFAPLLTAIKTRFGVLVLIIVTNQRWDRTSKTTRGSDVCGPEGVQLQTDAKKLSIEVSSCWVVQDAPRLVERTTWSVEPDAGSALAAK